MRRPSLSPRAGERIGNFILLAYAQANVLSTSVPALPLPGHVTAQLNCSGCPDIPLYELRSTVHPSMCHVCVSIIAGLSFFWSSVWATSLHSFAAAARFRGSWTYGHAYFATLVPDGTGAEDVDDDDDTVAVAVAAAAASVIVAVGVAVVPSTTVRAGAAVALSSS